MSDDAAEAVEAMQADAEAAVEADALECLIEAGTLTTVLDILQSAAHESVLRLGRDGLQTRMVDPANVFVVDVTLDSAAFADCGQGSFPIGVNLGQMQDYLSKADAGTLVSLSYDTTDRKLRIQYDGVDVTMAAINPDAIREEPDLSELDLPNSITVPADTYRDAIDVADMLSDHFAIEGRPDDAAVAITADGDTDDGEYVLTGDDVTEASVSEAVYSLFSIEYLLGTNPPGILKQMPRGVDLTVRFGEEFPAKYHFDFADGNGHVTMMQAPRIE